MLSRPARRLFRFRCEGGEQGAKALRRNQPPHSLEQLHQQIDEIRTLLVRSSQAQLTMQRAVPELADVYAHLMSADVESALSKDIIDRLEATMATDAFSTGAGNAGNRWKPQRADWGRLEAFLRVELENRVGLASASGN